MRAEAFSVKSIKDFTQSLLNIVYLEQWFLDPIREQCKQKLKCNPGITILFMLYNIHNLVL